ncbi:MAG: phospholipase D-like domain-containing protein [Pseudomonadota bacterium]
MATIAAGHALLYKRDHRSAFGWIAVCILFPVMGPLLYYVFGINRVQARAHDLARRSFWSLSVPHERGEAPPVRERSVASLHLNPAQAQLANISDAVSPSNLSLGNEVVLLRNGDDAFPRMLAAIERARHSIVLMTYILYSDTVGRRFVAALAQAAERGVAVYVILDGVGEFYAWPWPSRLLRNTAVKVSLFLPPRILPPSLTINLRNHRKLLVVDGDTAFTGGLNLGTRFCLEQSPVNRAVQDLHFEVTGPVVRDLTREFCNTWDFLTGSELQLPSNPGIEGNAICRMLVDGPDENMDRLELVLIGAITAARLTVDIMTPYFLPSRDMLAALKSAALKGVRVRIVLPARSNLRFVDWATRNLLWELLQWGVQVYYQPLPFAHTKLFTVDGHYSIVGSANLDPRSLRLNFELCLEVFDHGLAAELGDHVDSALAVSRPVTLTEVEQRPVLARLRDAFFWLFSPYL